MQVNSKYLLYTGPKANCLILKTNRSKMLTILFLSNFSCAAALFIATIRFQGNIGIHLSIGERDLCFW